VTRALTMNAPIFCLGVDPGREAGVALVELRPTPGKAPYPVLQGAWGVYGADDKLWWSRARAAAEEASASLGEAVPKIAFLEQIPVTFKSGSIPGVRRGHAAWAGLGKRWGAWQATLFAAGWEVRSIEQKVWVETCKVAASKEKAGGPEGRGREASALIAGARAALDKIGAGKLKSDVAESMLIGLAGACMLRRELDESRPSATR